MTSNYYLVTVPQDGRLLDQRGVKDYFEFCRRDQLTRTILLLTGGGGNGALVVNYYSDIWRLSCLGIFIPAIFYWCAHDGLAAGCVKLIMSTVGDDLLNFWKHVARIQRCVSRPRYCMPLWGQQRPYQELLVCEFRWLLFFCGD